MDNLTSAVILGIVVVGTSISFCIFLYYSTRQEQTVDQNKLLAKESRHSKI